MSDGHLVRRRQHERVRQIGKDRRYSPEGRHETARVQRWAASATAGRAGAQAIVTFNLDDSPADRLHPASIEAMHPDDFVIDASDL